MDCQQKNVVPMPPVYLPSDIYIRLTLDNKATQTSLHQPSTHSEKSKVPLVDISPANTSPVEVDDLVYLYSEGKKSHSSKCYLVILGNSQFCDARKFVSTQIHVCSVFYRVHDFDCFKVSNDLTGPSSHQKVPIDTNDSSSDKLPCELPKPPVPPPDPTSYKFLILLFKSDFE